MRNDNVRLFKTVEHPCGYYGDRIAQNWVIDPVAPGLAGVYGSALSQGFRRAGGHVYRPTCPACQACTPTRLRVAEFVGSRSQKRCMRANAGLSLSVQPAAFSDETFALYQRYLLSRHRNGGMDRTDPDDFSRFLYTHWSDTRFLMVREQGQLLACAVTDVTSNGLSAVYTFYEPTLPRRGLGTFCILSQIEWARREHRPYLYLGYWIQGHPKMNYKTEFQPIEMLRGGRWMEFDAQKPGQSGSATGRA